MPQDAQTAATAPGPNDADALFAALQHNWRKVASTDNLSLLAEEEALPHTASRRRSLLLGAAFVILGSSILVWALFATLVAKLMPPSSLPAIAAIQSDWYYCFLGPIMLPVTLIAVTANWFSLKLFKHNS